MNEQTAAALRKPFPADKIGKLPKGGTMLDYVGHAEVTDRLLEVDPAWTWRPTQPWPGFEQADGLFIELTVCGVTRPGFGEATGGFSPGDKVKAAIGDAIRNAAMRFGVALDLWMKDDAHTSRDLTFTSGGQKYEPHTTNVTVRPERKHYTQQTAGNNHGDPITENQRKLVYARLKSAGIHGAAVPEFLSTVTGRDVATIDELRKGDMDDVLAKIDAFRSVDDMWAGE